MLEVGGVVLCGGQSKRMGRAKAWLPFGAEFLLPRIVRLLGEATQPMVVVAAADQDLPPLAASTPIIRDALPFRGPLQGLLGGLSFLQERVDAVYLSSCDTPFLRPQFVRRLIELLQDNDICVPRVGGLFQPLAAVYRVSIINEVKRLLAEDQLRPAFLFDNVRTRVVEAAELTDVDPTLQSLRNVNTPGEYEAALREPD